MNERTSIFEPDPLDVSEFKPKTAGKAKPNQAQIDQISQPKFKSREAADEPADQPSTKRLPMVYRTGRNTTFSVKTTAATLDQFYEIARRQKWKAGETFEHAIEALLRELG
jgi:hypothetical protein